MHSIIKNGVLEYVDERDFHTIKNPFNYKKYKKHLYIWNDIKLVFLEDLPIDFIQLDRRRLDHAKTMEVKEITIPEGVTRISSKAFWHASAEGPFIINFPSTLKKIDDDAFYRTDVIKVNFNEGLEEIGDCVFYGMSNLRNMEGCKLPDSLKKIGSLGLYCRSIKEIEIPFDIEEIGSESIHRNLDSIKFGENMFTHNDFELKDFYLYKDFLHHVILHNKPIPKKTFIMAMLPPDQIENYYKHIKDWREVASAFKDKYNGEFMSDTFDLYKSICFIEDDYLSIVYSVCIALGLFDDKNSQPAKKFILDHLLKISPQELHDMFVGLSVRENGYNEEFANFFMTNYHEPVHNEELQCDINFMSRILKNNDLINLIPKAYNNWNIVKKKYPNKDVIASRERMSVNNRLTETDIYNAIYGVGFDNIRSGNEEMAEIVSGYGYTQKQFEELQDIWDAGKTIGRGEMILSVYEDCSDSDIKFELLDKNDPEGLIIGELTNCCQAIGNKGFSCLVYGSTQTNSGFVKFTHNGQIIGQSWVWYNPKNKIVCLDNIEVPTKWLKRMKNKDIEKEFTSCLLRLADSIKRSMHDNGYDVDMVTIGSGYNDFSAINNFSAFSSNRSELPEDYNGYSDALLKQYIIDSKCMECDYNS